MHPLEESVLKYIRKFELLRPGDRVGVAVSGGADSVALLRVLLELRRELGTVLLVIHLNHQIRGTESNADEEFVRAHAMANDLEFTSESCDAKAYASRKKLSLEAAARQVRYQFFWKTADQNNLDKIATAHTLDDQAETVLLKLARGAGTRGLAGIYPKVGNQPSAVSPQTERAVVRPLLWTRRSEIERYLRELGQSWREDASNCDLRHRRNRIRREILPRLEEQLNPRICETLAEAAAIARGEEEFWAEEVSNVLPRLWEKSGVGGVLDMAQLRRFPLALQRRLVRGAAESLGLDLEFRHVEEILGMAAKWARSSLPGGWLASWSRGSLIFRPGGEETSKSGYGYELQVPGAVELHEAGLRIEAVLVSKEVTPSRAAPRNDYVTALNRRRTLVVRNWRAGDRFWPAHAKGPKKIKELLQPKHITGGQKKLWPVIADGDEIIWVSGFGVSRDFQKKYGAGLLICDTPLE